MPSTSIRVALGATLAAATFALSGLASASPVPRAQLHPQVPASGLGLCPYTKITASVGRTIYQPGIESSHSITPVIFTNRGYPCVLWGVPVIQAVQGAKHTALGPPARSLSMGMMPAMHILRSGQSVSAIFGSTVYFSIGTCQAATSVGLNVSLPGFTHTAFVPLSVSVCAALNNTTTQLIVAGTHGV